MKAIAGSLAVAAGLALATPAAAAPVDGNGMWIWYVSRSGGTAERIAAKARHRHIEVVLIKSGDGQDHWSQFSPQLVDELQARGLTVCGWQFVYGEEPRREARVGEETVDAGADCLIIDAESHYEGKYAAADRYVRSLRRRIGRQYPLGLTSFPYVDYHPSFPYSVFMGRDGARFNLPQIYWKAIGTSVERAYSHTYRFNRPYGRPIFPLGQTWQDPPREEVIGFRLHARKYGAEGVSWWSWQETEGKEWRWVGKSLAEVDAELDATPAWTVLREGDSGDLVVWAQQLLRAAGEAVRVDGSFGGGMRRSVVSFQSRSEIPVTGSIGAQTWRPLLERRPVRTEWARKNPARVAQVASSARARPERSPLRYELAPTEGRP